MGRGVFSEWPESRLSTLSSFMNDVLAEFPSIVIGIFVYIVVVLATGTFSSLAGAVALAIIMIPIVATTTEAQRARQLADEAFSLAQDDVRESEERGPWTSGPRAADLIVPILIGAALGLYLLFGIPLFPAGLIAGAGAFGIPRARVMDKMGARSLSELIRMSLAAGLQPRP